MENKFCKLLEANNSVLLLVDYQARMVYGIESHDRTTLKNNVMALAKGAQVLGIPTILTTINAKNNGIFLPEIVEMMQTVSEWMNNWQNPKAGDMYMKVYRVYSGFFGQKEGE